MSNDAPGLCFFEDEHFTRLYPLTLTRPVYDLRCGISLLREKIARRFPNSRLHLFCREYLADVVRAAVPNLPVNTIPPENCLFINGRFIFGEKLPTFNSPEVVWKKDGEVAAAWISGNRLASLAEIKNGVIPTSWFDGLPVEEIDGTFIRYPWDLVHHNLERSKATLLF
jgi:hypothetical protein